MRTVSPKYSIIMAIIVWSLCLATLFAQDDGPISMPGEDMNVNEFSDYSDLLNFDRSSTILDSSAEYKSSCLWSNISEVLADSNIVYCALDNGLVVYDISDPSSPIELSILDFMPDHGDSRCLLKLGDYLYYLSYYSGLKIIDVSNPANPLIIGEWYDGEKYYFSFAIKNNRAYLSDGDSLLHVLDISDPANPNSITSLKLPSYALSLEISDSLIYAAVYSRMLIIDIANQDNPSLLNSYDLGNHNIYDIAVAGNLAYACVYGRGIQILDISDPLNITAFPLYPLYYPTGIMVKDSLAYIESNDIKILNVSNPNASIALDSLNDPNLAISGISIYEDKLYFAGGYFGFGALDISNPSSIEIIGGDPRSGSVRIEYISDSIAYLGCWNYGLRTVNISNPDAPIVLGGYYDLNLDLYSMIVRDSIAYTCGRKGLILFDVSDPISPTYISRWGDSTIEYYYEYQSMALLDDYLYVCYSNELVIFDISDPYKIDSLGVFPSPTSYLYPDDIVIQDTLAYVGSSGRLYIYNISNPVNPLLIDYLSVSGTLKRLLIKDNIVYGSDYTQSIYVIDVSDPTNPILIIEYKKLSGAIRQLQLIDSILYVGTSLGTQKVNVSNPAQPWKGSLITPPRNAHDIVLSEGLLYVAGYSSFTTFSLTDWVGSPDLIVDSLNVISFKPDSIEFYYRIKNIGLYPVDLEGPDSSNIDNLKFRAYLSFDSTPGNAGDILIGDFNISDSPAGQLLPDETKYGIIKTAATIDMSFQRLLATQVDPDNIISESNENNNISATLIGFICYDLPKPLLVAADCGEIHYYNYGLSYSYIYYFNVLNWAEYPVELFEVAPDLPPCGSNPNASRTWVTVYRKDGSYIYGFCGFNSPDDLNNVWFGWTPGATIDSVNLLIDDRRCGSIRSDNIDISQVGFPPIVLMRSNLYNIDTVLYEDKPVGVYCQVIGADTVYVNWGWHANDTLYARPGNSNQRYFVQLVAYNDCGSEQRHFYFTAEIRFVRPTNQWINVYCGSPMLNGYLLNPGDTIEAYDPDGVLCGRGFVKADHSFGFIPIYADDIYSTDIDEGAEAGDTILFKLNGTAVTTKPVIWTANGNSHEICDFCVEQCMTIQLDSGWNLISWNLDYNDEIENFINTNGACIQTILGFDRGGLTYDPLLPQFSTIDSLDYHFGYGFRMSCSTSIEICGCPINKNEGIAIYKGWNLVGLWSDWPLPVDWAIPSIYNCVDAILGYDHGGQAWYYDTPQFNTLEDMNPGFGYWLRSFCDTTLAYPGFTPYDNKNMIPKLSGKQTMEASQYWMSVYAENITIDGIPIKNGAEIKAYTDDGALCGNSIYDDNILRFMPIYGYDNLSKPSKNYPHDGENVHFYINGLKTDPEVVWSRDSMPIDISKRTAKVSVVIPERYSLAQNRPNPFNPQTSIEFALPKAGQTKLAIYNILGQRVVTLVDKMSEAGYHNINWNGTDAAGKEVASGIYFYRLESGDFSDSRKMLLLK